MDKAGSRNPVALGLVIVGAVAMAIATFLPFTEPTGVFAVVRTNTLIQHGGWWFLALAIAIAASGYRASQHRRREWVVPLILSGIAVIAIIFIATNEDLRTLYPIGLNGVPDSSAPGTVANFGVAIYVAGAGVAAAFIGSLLLQRPDDDIPEEWALEEAGEKKCPDCAEIVLADAKVCKHCGYRFTPQQGAAKVSTPHKTPAAKPPTNPPASTKPLRLGDRVKLAAPGDKNDGKTGKVIEVLDTGYVVVRFKGLWEALWEFPYRSNQLKRLDSPAK